MPRPRARHWSAAFAWLLLAALVTVVGSPPATGADVPQQVTSDAETVPTSHAGDSVDDPAVWVHPTDPSRSLVIANDKLGALETYALDGSRVQRLAFGTKFWGNVDVLQDATVAGRTRDLVGVVQQGVRFYTVDPATRLLDPVTEGDAPIGVNGGEGFCMYQSPTTRRVFGFAITIQGLVSQFELLDADGDGDLESRTVRSFQVGSEAEGCVADDDTGALYVSEENAALWRYSAEPDGGSTRRAVDVLTSAGGHLTHDVEGVALVDQPDGKGFVVVSAQGDDPQSSYFAVYRRDVGNTFVKTFRVTDGTGSDDCDHTDGIAATTAALGSRFPRGMFVCQDNNNDAPGTSGNQDLKLVRLEKVVNLDGGAEPPPPVDPPPASSTVSFVGQTTTNANTTSSTTPVPAATRVGDVLLLWASQNTEGALTGPGTGWTQVGRAVDTQHVTTLWRRVATSADAGAGVRVATGTTYTKVALTLAAYRGADPTAPVLSSAGAAEPGTTTAHTSPLLANTTDRALRVSYWSDRSGTTTAWQPPAGERSRATTSGTGGGHLTTLLTDPATDLTSGNPPSTGSLTATADAPSSVGTAWTVLLRPAPRSTTPDAPPVARFGSSCTDLRCSFDGLGSSDAEESIEGWAWDFGDGGRATGATPAHTYTSPGTYAVSLTVTDSGGNTHTVEHSVTVRRAPTIGFVGQSTLNTNGVAFSLDVPAAVRAGDALLLLVSQNTGAALTGPGAGWTQAGRVVDGDHATTLWRRQAGASDAGSTLDVASTTAWTKVAATLVAYRGADPTAPLVSATGAAETGTGTAHTTPRVAAVAGALRISYWSDRTSATTGWTAPGGETRRAVTAGTGGGRVSSLLTEAAAPVPASPTTTGGLVATADASADRATTWTILLRPAS